MQMIKIKTLAQVYKIIIIKDFKIQCMFYNRQYLNTRKDRITQYVRNRR